jgi:hypothetical protein
MLRKNVFFSMLLVVAVSLASCSGVPKSGGGGGGGGNTTLSLTMTDTLLTGTSILSFKATVTGVSFTPSTGKAVNLTLNPTSPIIEFTHLQSDSAFLGTSTLPSGNYTGAAVSFSAPDIVLINQTGGTLTGATPTSACVVGAVCEFKPATSGMITLTTTPFPLTLTANEQTGLSLDLNLNNVITMTNGAVSVDFTQLNVLSASTLPHTGTPTGALDLIEDFTGVITTISGNSVTVHSDTKGLITAVANSSTTFNITPPAVCAAQNITCLLANETVSIDASLNPDGTMTLLEADLLDNVAVDEVEGTVTNVDQAAPGTIDIVLSDKSVVSGNALLTAAPPGNVFAVSLGASPVSFSVDTKGLTAVTASLASIPFSTLSNVSTGQTVRMQVTKLAPVTNSTFITASTNSVVLRFSRVTGTVSIAPASSIFNLNPATLPLFITSLGTIVNVPVQISSGQTQFDGVSDITGLSQGDTVSIRALFVPPPLFLNSPFFAAKVRKHP